MLFILLVFPLTAQENSSDKAENTLETQGYQFIEDRELQINGPDGFVQVIKAENDDLTFYSGGGQFILKSDGQATLYGSDKLKSKSIKNIKYEILLPGIAKSETGAIFLSIKSKNRPKVKGLMRLEGGTFAVGLFWTQLPGKKRKLALENLTHKLDTKTANPVSVKKLSFGLQPDIEQNKKVELSGDEHFNSPSETAFDDYE